MNLKFPHPKKNKYFTWSEDAFVNDENQDKQRILEYSENLDGWSEHLTEMHENNLSNSHPIDIFSRTNCIKNIKKFSLNKNVIMDIGCSSGYLVKDLIQAFPKSFVIGADTIKGPLYRLSKEINSLPLLKFDLTKNPFPKSFVDVITLINVCEHIQDDKKALESCYKILNKKGLLVIEVPAMQLLYDNYDKELKHYRRYNIKKLAKTLEGIGFTIKYKTHLGFLIFPFFFIIKLINKIFNRKKIFKSQSTKSNNFITKILFILEEKIFSSYQLPFGIRCFICASKN